MQAIIAYRNADGTFEKARPLPGYDQGQDERPVLDGLSKIIARQMYKEQEAARRSTDK